MGRLVIHLGLPKSGSTAIQAFLSANAGELDRLGVHWCRSLRGPNHVQLAVAATTQLNHLSRTVGVRDERSRARLRARVVRRLGAEVAQHATVFASTEHLSSALTTPAEIDTLARMLAEITDDVLFVGVVRRGDYWLPSSYSEAVLNSKDLDLDAQFVRSRAALLDHRAFLTRWQDGFGADAVRLVPMLETDKDDADAVPLRVLAAVDIAAADDAHWQSPAAITHRTLSARATQLLRAVTPTLPQGGLRPGRQRMKVRGYVADRFPGASVRLTAAAAGELDRLGWRRTGIDAVPAAVGDRWSAWRDQPDAAPAELPQPSQAEVDELLVELRDAGLAGRRSTVIDESLRRVAIRIARR